MEEEEGTGGRNELDPPLTGYKATGIATMDVNCGALKNVVAIRNGTWREDRKRPAHSPHYAQKPRRCLGQRTRHAAFL